ncbi:hypothetical protein [Parasphingorhabdus flavimaris]|uniref:hypothetical protein n=1 Tax=Parasphingorhabdus flavimaris TaxID=266812 RepID=UPI00300346CC
MRKSLLLAATAITAISVPAYAQNDRADVDDNIIIVTAQRQAQSAQDVPIAVSAFSSEALEAQQIENSSDLQLTLPNITLYQNQLHQFQLHDPRDRRSLRGRVVRSGNGDPS